MSDDRLAIYDADDSSCRSFGENRDASRKLAISGGVAALKNSWDGFVKSPGGPYSRVVFDTHGNKGMIFFKHEAVLWGDVSRIFGGVDYGRIFPSFTRVYFDGCNVAEGDFGWLFLQEIAKALCGKGGGVVFGWTSKGYALSVWVTLHRTNGFTHGGRFDMSSRNRVDLSMTCSTRKTLRPQSPRRPRSVGSACPAIR